MPRLNPLSFIRAGLGEGMSANQAYQRMQEEADIQTDLTGDRWTGVRRTTFLQMFSATRAAHENVPEAINAPKDLPAGGLSIPERPSTVPSGFLNWGVAFTRPVGASDVERTFHPFRTQEPLTPAEVEDLIRQQIEESAQETHGTFSRYTIEGIMYTGTQQLVREQGA